MKKALFILFTLIIYAATAQNTVQIKVLERNNEPIVSAFIKYGIKPDKLDKHCIANVSGNAKISFTGKECYYKITSVGFISAEGKLLAKDTHKTIIMKEDVLGINEVVVTSSRSAVSIKKSPVITQVISGKALVDAGYGNMQQALMQETPGMNIRKVGFGNDMNMQGLDARHVLFLMDGERMTGEMAGNLDYERFNLHGIEKIEIVKGASSTLYGSRASGAVVNLITKKTKEPFSLMAGVRYGQMYERNYDNPQKRDFFYMYEKNSDRPNFQAWVSAGLKKKWLISQTDVWYSSTDAFSMYQKENDKKTYYASVNSSILKRDSTIISRLARPPMGISGGEHISASQKIYIEPNNNLSIQLYGTFFFMNTYDLIQDLYFTQSKDFTAGVKLKYKWNDYISFSGTLHNDFYQRFKRHERRDVQQKVYDSQIFQPRFNIESNYFKKHKLIAGVDYIKDDLTSDRFVNQKMTTRGLKEWEFFIQDSYLLNTKWTVEAGVRSTYSKHFGIMGLPKLAIKYSPNESWNYRLNYAMGYRSPSIKELFFHWDHLGMFQILGSEKLQPETNHYFSFSTELYTDKLFLSANTYGNFFYEKIEGVWKIYEMQYNFEYENLDTQRLLGFDLISRWHLSEAFLLNLSYSYVNIEDSHEAHISTTSPHAATGGLSYSYWHNKNYSLKASLTASFTGSKKIDIQDILIMKEKKQKADGTFEEVPTGKEAYFRCDLPAYVLCNFSINQTIYNKFKLSLGVNNFLNYVPETLGSGVTMFNIPATAGANFYVQLEFKI